MNLRKSTSTLLALSVFLTGSVGTLLGMSTPASAITSVDELSDVNRNHWAFEALRDLVEKYDVIEGYPDGTFRGDRMPTRWEMAAALNALIKTVGRDLARLGAEKADKKDLQTLARLQEEFRNELNALRSRVKALEDRAAAIEAKNDEQDNRLSLLEKTQIHGDVSFGFISDVSGQGQTRLDSPALRRGGNENSDGPLDGISSVARLRLALDIPIKEETEDSKIGRGDLYTRIIAAIGRNGSAGPSGNNIGANGPFNGFSRIASDADNVNNDAFLGGALGGGNGGNSRANLYMESVYYKQNFKSGIPVLTDWMGIWPDKEGWETTGDLYVGVVPWRFLFDKSPYRGNELTQFQNNSLVNTPGIPVNLNMPMVAYQWHQGLGESFNMDFTTALASPNVGDAMDGLVLGYEGRLNYITNFLGENYAKPGSLYAGGYHIFQAGNSLGGSVMVNRGAAAAIPIGTGVFPGNIDSLNEHGDDDMTSGFYAGWSQEWWRGIGTFVSYHVANNGESNALFTTMNQMNGFNGAGVVTGNPSPGVFVVTPIGVGIRQSLSTVLHLPMSALAPGWRDDDVLGLGYSFTDLQEGGLDTNDVPDGIEHVMEAYYKYQFTDSISIVPSVQFIFNRFGLNNNDFTTVFGLRSSFQF